MEECLETARCREPGPPSRWWWSSHQSTGDLVCAPLWPWQPPPFSLPLRLLPTSGAEPLWTSRLIEERLWWPAWVSTQWCGHRVQFPQSWSLSCLLPEATSALLGSPAVSTFLPATEWWLRWGLAWKCAVHLSQLLCCSLPWIPASGSVARNHHTHPDHLPTVLFQGQPLEENDNLKECDHFCGC